MSAASRWATHLAAGMCGKCGRVPPAAAKHCCAACLARVAEHIRKAKYRRRGQVPPPRKGPWRPIRPKGSAETPRECYARFRAAGLCIKCHKPTGGRQLCAAHVHARKVREAKKAGLIQA